MKYLRLLIIIFLIAFAFNCQQSKEPEKNKLEVHKLNTNEPKVIETNKQSGVKPCKYIITLILITSPRYKQLTRGLKNAVVNNGGLYYGVRLEGSPNPKSEKSSIYSETYDFTLFEMYSDRELKTARFTFNPDTELLYEYDAVEDKLNLIAFDRNLLKEYETCFN